MLEKTDVSIGIKAGDELGTFIKGVLRCFSF